MEPPLESSAGPRQCLLGTLGVLLFLFVLCLPPTGLAAVPGNDTCAGAMVVPPSGPFPYVSAVVDVTDATVGGDPPFPPPSTFFDTNVTRSVWYRFSPNDSGLYTLSVGADTATTVTDTSMVMYRSTAGCNGVNTIYAFNEDSGLLQSAITTNLLAGDDYFIVVWVGPIETATNNLKVQLRVSHPTVPANDSCAGAEVIPASIPATGYVTAVTDTTLATTTAGLTNRCVPLDPDRIPSRDVWYRFTPAASGSYTFSTKANETLTTVDDTLMAIYTSAAGCDSFVEVSGGCSDNDVNRAAFALSLTGGTPYYIVVWDNSPEVIPGETQVQLRVTPASAPTVTTLPVVSIASTGAVLSGSINANGLRSSFWFEWGPTSGLGSTSRVRFVFGTSASAIVTNLVVQPPFLQTFQPNSIYYYRFVAVNDSGMSRGEEQQFMWSNLSPRLATPTRVGNDVRLQFDGNPAQLYLIQSATNLASAAAWGDLGLATNTSGGSFQYLHRHGGADTNRLYRLVLP